MWTCNGEGGKEREGRREREGEVRRESEGGRERQRERRGWGKIEGERECEFMQCLSFSIGISHITKLLIIA